MSSGQRSGAKAEQDDEAGRYSTDTSLNMWPKSLTGKTYSFAIVICMLRCFVLCVGIRSNFSQLIMIHRSRQLEKLVSVVKKKRWGLSTHLSVVKVAKKKKKKKWCWSEPKLTLSWTCKWKLNDWLIVCSTEGVNSTAEQPGQGDEEKQAVEQKTRQGNVVAPQLRYL